METRDADRSGAQVLYLHPAKQEVDARYDRYIASPTYPLIPVGVLGLANMLIEEGLPLRGVNLPLELVMQPSFSLRQWLVRQGRPGLIMIDLHWYEHCFGALDVARTCKAVFPETPVVVGGLTASRFARSILAGFDEVDYVIRGDAERPLKLLAGLCCSGAASGASLARIPNLSYRDGGHVRENSQTYVATTADLDRLDFVSLRFLQHSESYAAIQYTGAGLVRPEQPQLKGHWLSIGRGCVYNCSFCGGARSTQRKLAGRDGIVLRSVERTLDDIARLKALGVHQVSLSLDPAIIGPHFWGPLFAGLRDRGLRIGIYNEFFQLPSEEFLSSFAEVSDRSHTEVAISPLSGNEHVRRRNGKLFSNQELFRTLDWLRARELPLYVYFSLNLPGETPKTFEETLRVAEQIGRRYPARLLRMINKCHTLDPGSPMSDTPSRFDVQPQYKTFIDYYGYCQQTGWQARIVTRGTLRGFASARLDPTQIEGLAQLWDAFAQEQEFTCFPVPRGW